VASLDPTSSAVVLAILRDLARQDGIAVLCSLHQIDLVAGFADRVIGLRGGRVVLDVAAKQFSRSQREGVYG
jgi:phosphonate transport system ATP-binding protein